MARSEKHHWISGLIIPFLILPLWLASWCGAQTPNPLRDEVLRAGTLSEKQKQRVGEWADYWSQKLNSGNTDPKSIMDAREKLLDPLRPVNPGLTNPTPAFRLEYTVTLLPTLEQLIAGDDPFTAINAIRVLQELGTDQSLRTLRNLLESPKQHLRQRAALGCELGLRAATSSPPLINLNERGINATVRALRAAAIHEKNHLVLRHLFTAIAAVNTPDAKAELIRAMKAVVERMAADPVAPNRHVEAIHVATLRLRKTFINFNFTVAQRRALGTSLGPVLGDFLAVIRTHWDNSHQEIKDRKMYGAAIQASESLLRIIDTEISGPGKAPQSRLRADWDASRKAPFQAGVDQWNDKVQKAPYQKN